MKLNLSAIEKQELRSQKLRIADLADYAVDEIEIILSSTKLRAREIYGLIAFQQIPSIGIKFAEDLIYLGYYNLKEIKNRSGAKLFEAYEIKKGCWIDSCVEDQFRLAVYYANNIGSKRQWWDFTTERKEYRLKNGYPENRPKKAWHEVMEK